MSVSHPAPVTIIGAPCDLGASLRGAAMGPAAFRIAGLQAHLEELGHAVRDLGDIAPAAAATSASGAINQAGAIAGWNVAIHDAVRASLEQGAVPLLLGGDHSLSIGSVSAAAAHAQEAGRKLAVLWIDAHADYNTPDTSPSGNLHGMPVAFLTGHRSLSGMLPGRSFPLLAHGDVQFLGLRSIDKRERDALAADGLNCADMRMVDEFGVSALMREFLGRLDPARTHLHVSFDLDVIDPAIAPGVGTPVEGGMTYREAHLVMELLHESGLMRSLDIVELNPFLDDRGRTARLAVDLAGSLFGRKVLARG